MHPDAEEPLDSYLSRIKEEQDPLQQARMMCTALAYYKIANTQLARLLGVKSPHVSQYLRVLKLPEIVLDGYHAKLVSFTHLIIISRLKTYEDIVSLYEEVLSKNYSITQTEHRVREILYQIKTVGAYLPSQKLRSYESRIASSLGYDAQLRIVQTRIRAKITIEVSGSLDKTSAFLSDFASRFRSRTKVKANEKSLHDQISQIAQEFGSSEQ
jgi:predicted transcriptional regulator